MSGAAARALALVGARFRAKGRDPATGLDCVGVALAATGRAGPDDYAMRWGDLAAVEAALAEAGLVPVTEAAPGDVALIDAGARQLHLAVRTERGHVHACARARRVIETPGSPDHVIGWWRG